MNSPDRQPSGPTIRESIEEYGRGIAGGLLFSLPLIYTMEVWWTGFIAGPVRLMVGMLGVFVLLLGYNRFAGMHPDTSLAEIVIDSVEELGLGLLISALMLFVLDRIQMGMSGPEVVGKIIVEAMTVAIGVSVGTAQLGGSTGHSEKTSDKSSEPEKSERRISGQMVLALCGGVLFAANVAPTEEVLMLAVEAPPWKLVLLLLLSLGLGLLILFFSGFDGAGEKLWGEGVSAWVFAASTTYAVALLASAALLWFFGRFDGCAPFVCLSQTVVLGLPATLGASAGRLLIQ